ncbi:MAG: putative ATPase component of various ABC-type transport system [Devosia sp.]|nr:putative ATPase component of various ABC-type transport system [Devosia sp.]
MNEPLHPQLLSIDRLAISYADGDERRRVVDEVSFDIASGEVVALVGESGSGKSTTAQAIIGLLPEGGRIDSGAIRLNGEAISHWSGKRLAALRGSVISLIPQDPGSSLNPVRTIGAQIGEIFRIHGERDRTAIAARTLDLLDRVGLSEPALRVRQYPHELSGGMKQRVLIAIAIALKPQLIIADEPTSALDVTVQRRVLDLIDEVRRDAGTALLLVTHDLGVAADRADRIVVLQGGRVQEVGVAAELLAHPRSAYARQLLADAPSLNARPTNRQPPVAGADSIVVAGLIQDFAVDRRTAIRAVDDISFTVRRGSTHALVGESGSGKTTTARSIVGFQRPTAGRILIEGTEISSLAGAALRQFRSRIQLVYQNPFSSLDPRQRVIDIVTEPLRNLSSLGPTERRAKAAALLERVGLPEALHMRRPRALSGGQRQRVAIARALVLDPEILVLDEAVSALDVTVQGHVLRLLDELQRERGLTYLFVSHDLAVVRQISDTVSVLQNGRVVESGTVADVFERPQSAYARQLIDAIPGRRSSAHVGQP